MSIISYAQNFEDVMLWRALSQVEHGFYIDIGAQDPLIDSVSLAFHEHGWRGIHVEPTPHYAELLRQQRPGDMIIQAAVGKGPAVLRFFEIPTTGISTADPVIAQQHRERGFDVREITVPCITLAAIFESCSTEPEIHWLKIDVEGFEKQALSSWGKSVVRPWIVVVESTLPLTQIESHESWESILIGYGYTPVYFDGLNRYYISDAHPELKNAFLAPPNVFDGFSLNGTASAPFHHLIDARYKEKISEILAQNEQQKQTAANEIERLTLGLAALDKSHAEQTSQIRQELENLLHAQVQREQEIAAQLLAVQHQAAQEKEEQAHSYADQERALHRQHAEQTSQIRQELESLLRAQVQREQEIAAQLLAIQHQAAQEKEEQAHSYAEQERALHRQHAEQTSQIRQELENHLRSQVQREQEIAAQLLAIQQQARQEMSEQAKSHSERACILQHQHDERLRAEREASQKLQQTLNGLQGELAILRNSKSWRFTAPLRAVASWVTASSENTFHAIQESTNNQIHSEEMSVTSNYHAQAMQVLPTSAATNLKALLQYQDVQFVECAYLTLLKRQPDTEGAKYYLGRLRAGVPKIWILGQLLDSNEARASGVKLPGLRGAVRKQKLSRLPLVGTILKLFVEVEGNSVFENRLRAIEQEICILGKQADARFERMCHDLNNLKELILQQGINPPQNIIPDSSLRSVMSDQVARWSN